MKIILLVCFALYLTACDKYPDYCKGGMDFEFDLPVSISPITDTIQLGDTLWVEMRVDNPILNKLDDKRYDISEADLFMFFSVNDLLAPTVVPTPNYNRLDENGNYQENTNPDGDNTNKVVFKKDGDQCYWRRGFVITKKGLYMVGLSDFIDRSHEPHITECPNEKVTFNYNINGSFDTQDKNFYFLQYSPDENVNSWSEAEFNQPQSGYYAICVD